MNSFSDFGEATLASIAGAMAMLFSAVPRILGFLLILLVGWFVATLIDKGVAALLRTVRFNDLAQRAGFTGFVKKMGVDSDAAGFLADLVKWFVRLIVLVVAFDALGLPAVSDVLRQLLLWLPNLVVAMVVLVVAGLAAEALGNLVRGSTSQAGFDNPELLARVAKVAVWAFAIVVAVNQIGIATTLVNTIVMATVGAVALAVGLAFGLGGRDTAAELVRQWRRNAQQAAPKIERASEAAADETRAPALGAPRRT
jgi:small-conductance mechanosensitive channel